MKRKEEVREKMHKLAIIESILNFFDCGIVIETFKNSLKTEMEMGLKNFIRHLFFGKGYADLTPPRLSEQMALHQDLLIVDLPDDQIDYRPRLAYRIKQWHHVAILSLLKVIVPVS